MGTYSGEGGEPTWAYYVMAARAKAEGHYQYMKPKQTFANYIWNNHTIGHSFEYDPGYRRFKGLGYVGNVRGVQGFGKWVSRDSHVPRGWVNNMFRTCQTILFDCRGPVVRQQPSTKNLEFFGAGLNGQFIAEPARTFFSQGSPTDAFIGRVKKSKAETKTLAGDYSQYAPEKREALKECDQKGRQVMAIFLGYPVTAIPTNVGDETTTKMEFGPNFEKIKTNGFEIGAGIDSQWSYGWGGKLVIRGFELASYEGGYSKTLNTLVSQNNGSKIADTYKESKKITTVALLKHFRNRGFIFWRNKPPTLEAGEMTWKDGAMATVSGWDYDISPVSAGLYPDGPSSHNGTFDLYDTNYAWDMESRVWSAMTAGLENKSPLPLPHAKVGNLFQFENEYELRSLMEQAGESEVQYAIIEKLKILADLPVPADKDTFKDRAVKWLSAGNPSDTFGYTLTVQKDLTIKYTEFKGTDDVIDEGHGGYWQFKITGGPGGQRCVAARNTFRVYATDETSMGFTVVFPQVNFPLDGNYQFKYWGFNVNPRAYKQMPVQEGVKDNNERPPFIPEYCWDRDQSFALFVPEVQGNVGQGGDDSGGGCFIGTVAFGTPGGR